MKMVRNSVRLGLALGGALAVLGATGTLAAAPSYFVMADVVRGAEGQPQGQVCVPNTVFYPGEAAVVRAQVIDALTGEPLSAEQAAQLGLKVEAHLGSQSVTLVYDLHPPAIPGKPTPPVRVGYWTGKWLIPADFPTGALNWDVTVQDAQGQKAQFTPLGAAIGFGAISILHHVG